MKSALLFRPRAVRSASQRTAGSDAASTNEIAANAALVAPAEGSGNVPAAPEARVKRQLSGDAGEQAQHKKLQSQQNSLKRELELREALLRRFLEEQRRLRERSEVADEPPQQDELDESGTRIHELELRDAEDGNEEDETKTEAEITGEHLHPTCTEQDPQPMLEGDDFDDEEGYYKLREDDVILQRYKVHSLLGKGVYSSVFKATDMLTSQPIAVKIMRNNQMMNAAGAKEAQILALLEDAAVTHNSTNAKLNVVSLLHSFTFRNHFCMILELAHCSLRRVIRKYKDGHGLSLSAVRTFGRQLFRALRHIHNAGVVHADIKPDNIVLNRKLNVAKICDFGSAYRVDELSSLSSTQYIVARYYRAPEIVLGYAEKGAAMDIWSMGVTLVEMYTSKLLFTGRHNNALLKGMMDLLGPFPKRLIRKSSHQSKYFTHDFKFMLMEENRGNSTESARPINPTRQMDLAAFFSVERDDIAEENASELQEFEDLVRQCLQFDTAERITADNALKHAFFKRTNTKQHR